MKKSYDMKFKSRVALEAIRGTKTLAELSSQYGVHSNQISKWKLQALKTIEGGFLNSSRQKTETEEITRDDLLKEIGQLKIENEFLKKKYRQLFE